MIVAPVVATASAPAAAEPAVVQVEAIGTAFRVTLSDGTRKQGVELAGTVLVLSMHGAAVRVRIAAVTADPKDISGAVLLHDFRHEPSGAPVCDPDAEGQRLGFPLAGRTTAGGSFVRSRINTFEIACTAASQGRCVRLGYHPWTTAPDGRPMLEYFNACIRLMRADYCGDGRSWANPAAGVDVFDDVGIQRPATRGDPSHAFEAGWTSDGAVCVARMRATAMAALERLKSDCRQLAALSRCDVGAARAAGAILYSRSR